MHLISRKDGFMGSTSIVGGTIPVGVGLAWAKRLRKESGVVVVFHGDAAVEEGVWHESVNFAVLHKLPVLFVCENNQLSCFTDISRRQPRRVIYKLAQAHGMEVAFINDQAHNPEVIEHAARHLRTHAETKGPAFLEIMTFRYLEHCGPGNDDHLNYRDLNRLELYKANDPLKGVIPSKAMMEEIDQAFRLAEHAPNPVDVGDYAS